MKTHQEAPSAMLVAEKGKPPHVPQADGVAQTGDKEVTRVGPVAALSPLWTSLLLVVFVIVIIPVICLHFLKSTIRSEVFLSTIPMVLDNMSFCPDFLEFLHYQQHQSLLLLLLLLSL